MENEKPIRVFALDCADEAFDNCIHVGSINASEDSWVVRSREMRRQYMLCLLRGYTAELICGWLYFNIKHHYKGVAENAPHAQGCAEQSPVSACDERGRSQGAVGPLPEAKSYLARLEGVYPE